MNLPKNARPVKEIVQEWIGKGAKEIYGFSGRCGMIFLNLEEYLSCDFFVVLSKKGYLRGYNKNGSWKIGQIVHKDFGWS